MELKEKIKSLPHSPGVYQYFDKEGVLIYVGKAKDLRKRVSSYFVKNHTSAKLRILVRKIVDVKHLVVETESDALLLENNLIKKHQPRYNVLLKDDKSYPWVCVKKEPFPRVFKTRKLIKDGSQYFGPFTSGYMLKTVMEFIKQMYPLRTCRHALTSENIYKGKFKVCLEYHIGNCKGACEGLQTEVEYQKYIDSVIQILKGNVSGVERYLREEMMQLAEDFKFEQAEQAKKKLELLGNYQSKSAIVNLRIRDVDVYSIVSDDSNAYVNYIKVKSGGVVQSYTLEIEKRLDESDEELLAMGVFEIRSKIESAARDVFLSMPVEFEIADVRVTIPQKGEKRKLIELSEKNAKYFRLEKLKWKEAADVVTREDRLMETMQKDLSLKVQPKRIECFDNSNIQGTNPVASCVVFINGRPAKKQYRHFMIKTVVGPDDFASMEEIIYRRYKRQLDEGGELPNLIVIDGGKGQLHAALNSLEKLNLRGKIPIIGIAKRLEELYFPGDPDPLYLDKNSETLKTIQFLRNEAHRFGIKFHRDKRSQNFIGSELLQIKGVGENTANLLLKEMKSIDAIKKASVEDLKKHVGLAKAKLILAYFKK